MWESFMFVLRQLTENKLFASVVPVILGAGLLTLLFKRRDRRIAVLDESLKFVNEVADLLNRALSPVFAAAWFKSLDRLEIADQGIAALFQHRLSTRAKSTALLRQPQFWRGYETITWRLRELVDATRRQSATAADSPPVKDIHAAATTDASPDWDHVFEEANKIWRSADMLVTAGIETALGRSVRFPVVATGSADPTRRRNE
jgi:hypothetical protein